MKLLEAFAGVKVQYRFPPSFEGSSGLPPPLVQQHSRGGDRSVFCSVQQDVFR